jgi:hypothetical protein
LRYYSLVTADAKGAEFSYFMFAADPPKIPADRKDSKLKGQSVSSARKYLGVMKQKQQATLMPMGVFF